MTPDQPNATPTIEDVRELSRRVVLCWLATVDARGDPSLSPKEIFTVSDGAVWIANIASPGSADNIRAHARAAVAILDPFVQKGYKVAGAASVLPAETPATAEPWRGLRALAGERFPFRSVLRIAAEEITPIVAPSYRFHPETTETAQVASALKTYAVEAARNPAGEWKRDVR